MDKGDFVFVLRVGPRQRADAPGPVTQPTPYLIDPRAIELTYWASIKDSKDPEDFKAYLETYPGGIFARLAKNRIDLLNASSVKSREQPKGGETSPISPPPVPSIPHGPANIAPHHSYTLPGSTRRLTLRALTVETNNDQMLGDKVHKETSSLSKAGSHNWDNRWYHWRLPTGANLLLAWGDTKVMAWVLVQRDNGAWWYKTNSGEWVHMPVGDTKTITWPVEGQNVSISIEIPKRGAGWGDDDVKYKFGY